MSSGQEEIFPLIQIFGGKNFRSDHTSDRPVLLGLAKRGVHIHTRIISSLAEGRPRIGFIIRIDRPPDNSMRGKIVGRRYFVVTRIVQRDEIRAEIPADADLNAPPIGADAIFFEDFFVLISAPQLRIRQFDMIETKSRIGRARCPIHLQSGRLENVGG